MQPTTTSATTANRLRRTCCIAAIGVVLGGSVAAVPIRASASASASAATAVAVPGTVLEQRPFQADWLPDSAAGSTWVRYATTDVLDRPAESTGYVLTPAGRAPAGGWPVVSWAHGTQGTADACAPTVSGPYAKDRDAAYIGHWLDQGYAVVASDYAGLGSAGDHAYLHGPSVAHNIVDMVTASHDLRGVPALSTSWVSVGHSQGAGAALYTARYASELDGDLDHRGMVGTGTPVRVADDIVALAPGAPGVPVDPHVTAYVAYMLDGIRQVAPQLDGVLSDLGRDVLATSRTECLADLSETLRGVVIGDLFSAPVASDPTLVAAVRRYLDIPESGFTEPFLLAHGTADVDVRYERTARYAADLAADGEPITFRTYDGVDHGGTVTAALADTTAFVRQRFGDRAR